MPYDNLCHTVLSYSISNQLKIYQLCSDVQETIQSRLLSFCGSPREDFAIFSPYIPLVVTAINFRAILKICSLYNNIRNIIEAYNSSCLCNQCLSPLML